MFKRKSKGSGNFKAQLMANDKVQLRWGSQERGYIQDLSERLLVHHGKETTHMIKTLLSRRWRPGMAAMRPFPAMRSGRLRDSIGYIVYRAGGDTVKLSTGILVKTDLAKGQLPTSVWGRFHEYGHIVKIKDPSRPFFYIPTKGSPAMGPDGQIDRSWLPGMALREKLKRLGANLGARAFYFPMPKSKSAKKRSIYIAAIRWRDGQPQYVLPPTRIAIGVREFTIPERPYLRPSWDRLYNSRGDGRLNKDTEKTADEIEWVIKGGLRGNTLADYEQAVLTAVVNLKL